jgi:tRNA pseudouridine55 synthase
VSAIKVNGRRAYARIHAGEDVQLAARQVHVASLTVVALRRADTVVDVDVSVQCSLAPMSGRSLATSGRTCV